ncbi:hypothetical protein LTS18_007368 [Coniosporium uncinatum]|uniref:Uncharacterized protein n=1 Tax=Coniosporium uncinatum TaxID=93489 RepID=A0ACC3DCL9_9PEZI|nr:hypothetical protein LTS18_007368 [Coniosporium uncinatum]
MKDIPKSTTFELAVAVHIQATLRQAWFTQEGDRTRVLVYVRMRSQADALAEALGCARYYSDSGTEEEKAEVLTRWIEGRRSRILVATSALAGVDYRHVRVAFHVGEPGGGAIDYAQDVGRVGRDGQGGLCAVFLPPRWQATYNREGGELLSENTKAMQRFLDSPRCRMVPLSEYLDGRGQSCKNEATACDRCRLMGLPSNSILRHESLLTSLYSPHIPPYST